MTSKVQQYEESIVSREPAQHSCNYDVAIQTNPHYISLRSRAERDIVNDSKRNICLLQIYEQLANSSETDCTPYSIDRLKGLRSLNLSSCNRITDISLKYAFDFAELESLSLSKCQQITAAGFEASVMKCPSIKVLVLSGCHNLCDRAIDIISVHLKRLRFLHIERCSQLTDASLNSISKHCKRLKYLDVRGCRSMCAEPCVKLDALVSLQHILASKPGPYLEHHEKQSVPKPPPPAF